jgi:hypothetical protein
MGIRKIRIGGWIIITLIIAAAFYLASPKQSSITSFATFANQGCCEPICQQTGQSDCFGTFHAGLECTQLDQCNIGCCIDTEGYCLSNYLKANCEVGEGEFIEEKECPQYIQCITEPSQESLMGFTGYNFIFPASQEGVLFVEPVAGKGNTPFTIKMQVFGQANDVKASITSEGYSTTISLYNDGSHGDGNPNDNLFAGIWQSEAFPPFEGIRRVNVTTSVDGSSSNASDYLLLTSNNCLPLRKPWDDPATRQDIIFIKVGATEQTSSFEAHALNIVGHMSSVFPLVDGIDKRNFYIITENLQQRDSQIAREKVQQQCDFYNPEQDVIIFFDDEFNYCEQETEMITTNPRLLFNRTALEEMTNLDTFMERFCDIIVTEAQLQEIIEQSRIAPNITVILPQNNSRHNTSEIEAQFVIYDNKNATLDYEIYQDINNPLMVIKTGTAQTGQKETTTVTLTDGSHDIWIETRDGDHNLGHSTITIVNINVSNFIIDITSLDPLYYNSSPEINFTISHASDIQINYTVLLNTSTQINGTAITEEIVTIPTTLTNGTYTIQITAADRQNRTATSLPYIIYIGEQQ